MSDEMKQRVTAWLQKAKDNRRDAVKFVLMAMKLHNVKCVVCTYSGEGDSGCIEETMVLLEPIEPDDWRDLGGDSKDDEAGKKALENSPSAALLEAFQSVKLGNLFSGTAGEIDSLLDAITYAADYVCPQGYEINEGGQGVIVFDAVANECRSENGSNHVEVSYDTETISLEEEADAEVPG
jgi:hypothetical protein